MIFFLRFYCNILAIKIHKIACYFQCKVFQVKNNFVRLYIHCFLSEECITCRYKTSNNQRAKTSSMQNASFRLLVNVFSVALCCDSLQHTSPGREGATNPRSPKTIKAQQTGSGDPGQTTCSGGRRGKDRLIENSDRGWILPSRSGPDQNLPLLSGDGPFITRAEWDYKRKQSPEVEGELMHRERQ